MMEIIPTWSVRVQTSGGDVAAFRVSERDIEALVRTFLLSGVMNFSFDPERLGTALDEVLDRIGNTFSDAPRKEQHDG